MKQFDEDDLKAEEEAGKSFLLDKSDRIGIAIVVVLELILIPTILFLPRAFKSSGGPYYKCEVLDVIDGKTLKVHLLEIEKGFYPGDSDMPLMGIWSDESQEPEIHYKNRIQLFRQHFVGQVLRSQTEVYVVDPNPPEPPRGINDGSTDRLRSTQPRQPIMIFQTPQRPSEVLLTDGSSFNQFLLANGYAVFDFTDRFLGKDDRARYEAAEVQARTARLGVWSSPESAEKYLTARATFERQERFKGAGLVLYLVTQAVLIVVIVLLMYGSRKTYGHESFIAVSKLLAIPGILLLVVFLRLVWVSPFPAENPNAQALYVSYMIFVAVVFIWGAKQFFTLVALGPLKAWQSLWKSSRAKRVVVIFFTGLGIWIVLFTIIYRLGGGVDSTPASLRISLSQTLNLGYPLPKTAALEKIAMGQTVVLWLWLFVCGVFVPGLKDERAVNPSLSNAMFTSLTSLVMLALLMASVFANIFYYNIQLTGFNRPLDIAECFFLAIFIFIRKSYGNVYPTSGWMMLLQSLEVVLAFFLQLVGLRFIFSSVKRLVDARIDR